MGCALHRYDNTAYNKIKSLKSKMYSKTTSEQRTSTSNLSIEPIQVFNENSSIHETNNIVNEDTIRLIKYEIDNPWIDGNYVSYGSPTLTDICLKNPRRQNRVCDSIMQRVNNLRSC